jgi:DNA polymerase elongation subunit (family B)
MLEKIQLENILFLDIETVPQTYQYNAVDAQTKELFEAKNRSQKTDFNTFDEIYQGRAGILAEFGKIVCISVGYIRSNSFGENTMRIKSFAHQDEETLLNQFKSLLDEHFASPNNILCGHNAKEFDFPYICRRMLIHGIKLPSILNMAEKKPWEINHLDTMELWKFGDYKAYTSLALLCHVFNIPTPKDDISGADVARVYYEENDLERISKYCEKDVVALIQLFFKMMGKSTISDSNIQLA